MSRPNRDRRQTLSCLAHILLGTLAFTFGATSAAIAQSVWELTPYRIRVVLCLQHAAELTPALESDLRTGLVNQSDLRIGAAWQVSWGSAPATLAEQMIADMPSVTVDSLPMEWLDDDKVALLAIAVTVDGCQVTGRELDVRTRVWSPIVRVLSPHPARLCDTLFWVLHRTFAPLALIEFASPAQVASGDQGMPTLRLRAASLPARDPTCLVTGPGTVFQPFIRHNNRDGKLRQITPAPWTYLIVTEVTKAELKCKLYTGIRSPLSTQRRGRVEQLALAIPPIYSPTRLVLRSRNDKNKPLVGYEIYRQLGETKNTAYLGRTDRRGAVLLEPGNDASLRMLVIKNGNEVLARLPMVLGLEPEVIAPIADDDQRLEAEGFIAGFQEELVDLVARRQVLQGQIRARIEAGEFDKAEALLSTLRQMKGRDDCLADLNREKQRVFSKDMVIQRKIDKLFTDTQTLLNQHLDPTAVERLLRELNQARKGKANAS